MLNNRQSALAARRLYRLCVVDGRLDEHRARLVIARVLDTGRSGILPIAARFRRLIKLDLERRTALVESATPLPPATRAVIEARLLQTRGPGLTVTFGENPTLVAGIRIAVGGDIYDDSIRGRLAAVDACFSRSGRP
jgi:F-type H+-transporting ATPase subunit delta